MNRNPFALSLAAARGALAGGAIGAATGPMVGSAATPPSGRCAQWGYDNTGNPVGMAFTSSQVRRT